MDKHDYEKKLEKELEKFASNTYTLIEQAITIAENSPKNNMPKIEVFATLDGITAEWETERYSISIDYLIGKGSSLCIENKFGTSNKECKDIKEAVSLVYEYIENDKKINYCRSTNAAELIATSSHAVLCPTCPACGSSKTHYDTIYGKYKCSACGYKWDE